MNNSPPNTRSRKRNRQVRFDLNRSSPHVLYKICKPNTPKTKITLEMAEKNQDNEQIRDISKTIITSNPNVPQGVNVLPTDLLAQGTSRQPNQSNNLEKIEESIKKLVDQGVNSQVADIKKTMAQLTSTISRLSIVVQQTQHENRKLMEANLPNVSKTLHEGQQPMDISGIQPQLSHSSRASSVCSDESRSYSRPRIDKWGLEFDGDSNRLAVEDFVFRLERLQAQYGVSWKEVLDNFHLLVKGAAEKWYWLFIQTNYVSEWSTLKSALLKQYRSTRSSFEMMRDMVERKQLPGESIDAFFFAMTQYRSRLTISMPEAEMIIMIKKNIREAIGRIVYPMAVASVEELRMCCLDAEKTFLKKEVRPQPPVINRYTRHVNEMYNEPQEIQKNIDVDSEEVAAIRLGSTNNSASKTPLICWNCRQNGHMFMDCPADQRTIFCYRCGKPDTIAPNCDNCRNRNFIRNEGKAGDHRSTNIPQNNL